MNQPAPQPLDEEDLPEEEESAVGHLWKSSLLDNDGATKAACDRAYSAYIRHTNGSRGIVVRNRSDEPSRVYLPLSLADEGPRMAELRRVVDQLCPEPAKLAVVPAPSDRALFDSIIDTLLPAAPENTMDDLNGKILKALGDGHSDRKAIAKACGETVGKVGYCLAKHLVPEREVVAVGVTQSRRYYLPGKVPAAGAPKAEKAPRAKAPKAKPSTKKPARAAKKAAAPSPIDDDGAVAVLVAKRQRHLDAVARLDMVIAVLTEGAS